MAAASEYQERLRAESLVIAQKRNLVQSSYRFEMIRKLTFNNVEPSQAQILGTSLTFSVDASSLNLQNSLNKRFDLY